MIQYINKWDFVYFDPPYDPVSDTSSFTWYTLDWFGKEDQIKLRDFCVQVDKIWAKFLLSNSATRFIREIYSEWDFKEIHIETVSVPRTINANANWRWEVDEFLVHNYKLNGRK
jgi:DNA adenine methylase